jgi:voltage-gated potassium channel
MDFLDVVMHDGSLELRMEEALVAAGSELAGRTLGSVDLVQRTGAQLLAIRSAGGSWSSNPAPDFRLEPGSILIAIGTATQVRALQALAAGRAEGRTADRADIPASGSAVHRREPGARPA